MEPFAMRVLKDKGHLPFVRMVAVALVATICSLSLHIWLVRWAESRNLEIVPQAQMTTYDLFTICMAYVTAFVQTVFLSFIYLYSSHIIPIRKRLLKALLVTVVVLGIEGELFRQPLMNFVCNLQLGYGNAFLVSLTHQLSIWVPKFLLCALIVFFVPEKAVVSKT